MRFTIPLIFAFPIVTACSTATYQRPTEAKVEWKGDQAVPLFISKLKTVADSGMLSDVTTVSKLLGLSFVSTSKEAEPQPAMCVKTMSIKSRQITTYEVTEDNWYQPTPVGIPNLEVPGFAINPAFVIDHNRPPTVRYGSHKLVYCADPIVAAREMTETQLEFSNLPSYACITQRDIHSLLPAVEPHLATDGYEFYFYQGNVNDQTGTTLEFSFRAFVSCALSAKIEQSTRTGSHYKKVNSELGSCRRAALEKYREAHPQVRWSDTRDIVAKAKYAEDIDAKDQYMAKACGTFEDLYRAKF